MNESKSNLNDPSTALKRSSIQDSKSQSEEIDLKELLSVIWAGKALIIWVSGLFAALAVLYALLQPNIYRSEALLAPVQAADSASALASKFGGLASLAGVNIPIGSVDKTSLAIEYVKSRVFFKTFMQNHPSVLPELMAVDKWNAKDNTLKFDDELYNLETDEWVREVDFPKKPKPSAQEAHLVFREILSISQDKESSFVTFAVEHQSPYVAAQWVGWLVEDLNNALRENDIAQSKRSIAYVQSELENTSISEMRSSLFELIQSQTQTIMLANASPEYIFKTVDPGVVPELKAKPQRALIVVLGVMLGGMLSVLIVLVRNYRKNEDAAS
ncbi:MAG: hypothetical protein ACI9O6_000650 [Glaciecola sp.]|jgi:uncharacterized protein involved in exopolysaccharide biosynthesis